MEFRSRVRQRQHRNWDAREDICSEVSRAVNHQAPHLQLPEPCLRAGFSEPHWSHSSIPLSRQYSSLQSLHHWIGRIQCLLLWVLSFTYLPPDQQEEGATSFSSVVFGWVFLACANCVTQARTNPALCPALAGPSLDPIVAKSSSNFSEMMRACNRKYLYRFWAKFYFLSARTKARMQSWCVNQSHTLSYKWCFSQRAKKSLSYHKWCEAWKFEMLHGGGFSIFYYLCTVSWICHIIGSGNSRYPDCHRAVKVSSPSAVRNCWRHWFSLQPSSKAGCNSYVVPVRWLKIEVGEQEDDEHKAAFVRHAVSY